MAYPKSNFSFERTELRTLQNQCGDDNELFLNMVADMLGYKNQELEKAQHRANIAEELVRRYEND